MHRVVATVKVLADDLGVGVKLGVVGLVAVALVAGCSIGSKAGTTPAPTSSKPAAAVKPAVVKQKTYPGENAGTIAAGIKGCTSFKHLLIGSHPDGLASASSCVLHGRTVTVDSWKTIADVDSVGDVLASDKHTIYYVSGDGWTALVTEDPTYQHQLTNDAAWLLEHASDAVPSPDLPGEKSTAAEIAKQFAGATVQTAL